jgi:hypothetical protein
VGEFENESAALVDLSSNVFVEKRRVYAVIGLLLSFSSAVLYVATKLRAASLPGGVKVSVLVQTDTISIPLVLNNEHLHSREQLYNISALNRRYPLDELHYFSSLDLTVPFGSSKGICDPAGPSFAWNDCLRECFVQESLGRFW